MTENTSTAPTFDEAKIEQCVLIIAEMPDWRRAMDLIAKDLIAIHAAFEKREIYLPPHAPETEWVHFTEAARRLAEFVKWA